MKPEKNDGHTAVNARNAPESYPLKWFVACYVNFTSVKIEERVEERVGERRKAEWEREGGR